jgi:hypothetical protein
MVRNLSQHRHTGVDAGMTNPKDFFSETQQNRVKNV